MKTLTLFPLGSYKSKIAGIILSIASIILMLVSNVFEDFIIISKYTNAQHFQFFILVFVVGLYLIAYSKEKIDDERVEKIRARALRVAFGVSMATLISFSFVKILSPSLENLSAEPFMVLAAIGLIIYLLVFYIGLFFDSEILIYNDDTLTANLKKNRLFFLIYTSIIAVAILLVFIF